MFAKSIPLLACFAALANAAVPDLTGSGYLLVLNGTAGIGQGQTEADKVGCLNAEGFLVLDDCAVFSDITTAPQTSAGQCTFTDESQPINSDSIYGQSDHAWHCFEGSDATNYRLYSIDGFTEPYVCQGDIDCLWDVNKAPDAGEVLPVWPFRWGSQQLGITPGHLQTLLLWKKIEE